MPSNEAIELLESVLSESERAIYRVNDILDKKISNKEKELEAEDDFIKKSRLKTDLDSLKIKRERNNAAGHRAIVSPDHKVTADEIRKGTKDKSKQRNYKYIRSGGGLDADETALRPYSSTGVDVNLFNGIYRNKTKHEAACILIEALNTLLNE